MIDLLFDNFEIHCLYLIDIGVRFTEQNKLELFSQLTYVVPWLLKPELDLYDTDGRKRFKIKTPLILRKQGNQNVFKTGKLAIQVEEIYLL